jgi:hypothetical protein
MMDWTLARIVRSHAAARGQRPMLTYGGRTITDARMGETSNLVVQGLLAEGVGQNSRRPTCM